VEDTALQAEKADGRTRWTVDSEIKIFRRSRDGAAPASAICRIKPWSSPTVIGPAGIDAYGPCR